MQHLLLHAKQAVNSQFALDELVKAYGPFDNAAKEKALEVIAKTGE